jgi:hypothetical protein
VTVRIGLDDGLDTDPRSDRVADGCEIRAQCV